MGQGQIAFGNLFKGYVNAPISDAAGQLITWPSPYVADLFYSSNTHALMDELIATGQPVDFLAPTNYGAGYFFLRTVTLPVVGVILAQVRAWDTNYGSTYYEARDKGGEFGFSNLILTDAGAPPGVPGLLIGLQSFQLQRLPRLNIRSTAANTLLFSWPTNITAYALQQNGGFNTSNWATLPKPPVVVGSQNQVTIPNPSETRYYRLVSQ